MMPVVMLKAGCQGGPGSQVWTPTLCLQVMVAGNQATGEFGGWGGHRPDGVSSSEGPGGRVGQFKGACWCDTPHGPSVQLGRCPLSVCSSNLEEVLQGSMAGEEWVARPVQASKNRAERERGPEAAEHRAGFMLRKRRNGSLQPGRVSV